MQTLYIMQLFLYPQFFIPVCLFLSSILTLVYCKGCDTHCCDRQQRKTRLSTPPTFHVSYVYLLSLIDSTQLCIKKSLSMQRFPMQADHECFHIFNTMISSGSDCLKDQKNPCPPTSKFISSLLLKCQLQHLVICVNNTLLLFNHWLLCVFQ